VEFYILRGRYNDATVHFKKYIYLFRCSGFTDQDCQLGATMAEAGSTHSDRSTDVVEEVHHQWMKCREQYNYLKSKIEMMITLLERSYILKGKSLSTAKPKKTLEVIKLHEQNETTRAVRLAHYVRANVYRTNIGGNGSQHEELTS
jgi:hypothetical protein